MTNLNIESIIKCRKEFPDLIKETPLEFNQRLSEKYSCKVYLKREDRQLIRSYKIRGAFNAIKSLKKSQREKGVVCASAGNHAQGVALSCKYFKIKCTIFMPLTTPKQKIRATKKFGGNFVNVVLEGDDFDESYEASMNFCKKKKSNFIHPFDNLNTIEGQATIGYEVLNQIKEKVDYVFIPVGGGGLISGVGFYFSKKSLQTKIIGAEPLGALSMKKSLSSGRVIELKEIDNFVDGASVKKVGSMAFNLSKKFIKGIVAVPENRLCSTMVDFLQEEGITLEPAGALSIDALKNYKNKIKNKVVVCIVSGGNFDFDRLPEIKERALRYEGLKRGYTIMFPQRAGALKEFLNLLGPKDNIVKFEYFKKPGRNKAPVVMEIESNSSANLEILEKKLGKSKFEIISVR